jgi:transcriptional regulator
MTNLFVPRQASDVAKLVDAYPLCWIVSGAADDRLATPLPLLAERDADGNVTALFGHIGRSNAQQAALERDPRAAILCMGPQGYVSPRLVANPTWGPTWNYGACRFEVDVEFVPDETDSALSRLAEALEGSGEGAWRPDRMGPRYEKLKQFIIAFRAHVREAHPRFKLGQDESEATFNEIIEGHTDRNLIDWMQRSRG